MTRTDSDSPSKATRADSVQQDDSDGLGFVWRDYSDGLGRRTVDAGARAVLLEQLHRAAQLYRADDSD